MIMTEGFKFLRVWI